MFSQLLVVGRSESEMREIREIRCGCETGAEERREDWGGDEAYADLRDRV